MKSNFNYSSTYIGTVHCTLRPGHIDEALLKEIKKAVKGTNFSIRKCGRHPKRTLVMYGPSGKPKSVRGSRGGIHQDFPVSHSTSIALYLKQVRYSYNANVWGNGTFLDAAERAKKNIANIFVGKSFNGVKIKAVKKPSKFLREILSTL